jgi:DNA (cytosine-5)-methyltransferase 1
MSRPIGFYWTEGKFATGLGADCIPPLKAGSTIGIPSPPAILFPDGNIGTPHIEDAERLQGFPRRWTEPALEVAKASARWRLLGNAVSVNVSTWVAERLVAQPEGRFSSARQSRLIEGKWPAAAWGRKGERVAVELTTWPTRRKSCLAEFIKNPPKPLSKKATSGFLARAKGGNLRFPDGFLKAIEQYLMTC